MQYLSPSAFLGDALSGPLDKKAIQLGRKKLFAELELSGSSTIELQGRPFTKNDIIQYLDDLLKEDALSYHSAVAEDQILLGFLEDARIGPKARFQNNPLYEKEQFIQWISPYFHNSFTSFISACFLQPDEDQLTALLDNKLMMTSRDLELSWDAVTRNILNDLSTLEQFYEQSKNRYTAGEMIVPLVSGLMEYSYIRTICLLPQSRFASLRDEYALCMQNVCIEVFNNRIQYRQDVRIWMDNAILMAFSQEVKNVLTEKRDEMEAIIADAEKNNGLSSTALIKIVGFALFIIFKVATCGTWNTSPGYDYRSAPVHTIILDSLVNKYRDTQALQLLRPTDSGFHKKNDRPVFQ